MAAMPIDSEDMEFAGIIFCLPMTLLINFSLFQYLSTFYYKRRREVRGMLLILCALGGFAAIVPFAHSKRFLVGHLNDISETFTVLTFLIQIVIVGRDVNKKVRIRSLRFLSIYGELLVIVGLFVVLMNLIEVTMPHVDISAFDGVDNIFENLALVFIFFARFYYIVISRGIKETIKTKKLEMVAYALFLTHEYPFMLLESLTGVSWELVQALWHRLTVSFCILLTIREKMRSITSKQSKLNNTNHTNNTTRGPAEKSLYVSDNDTSVVPAGPKPVGPKSVGSLKSIVVGASVRPLSKR